MAQKRSLFKGPPPAPNVELPWEGPNRPLGQDVLGDLIELLGSGVGVSNPLDSDASSATQLGGLLGAILPLSKFLKAGKVTGPSQEVLDEIKAFHARPTPGSMAEFAPVTEGGYPPLTLEEAAKELELMGSKPSNPGDKILREHELPTTKKPTPRKPGGAK